MADELEAIEIEVTPEPDAGEPAAKEPAKVDTKAAGTAPAEKAPAAETPPVEKAAAVETPTDDPQKGIEELKRNLEGRAAEAERQSRLSEEQRQAEARRREEAERTAAAATAEAETARSEAMKRELESVSSALTSLESERNALKNSLKEFLEKGDFTNAAEVQSQIGEASGRIVILREGKAQLESRRDQLAKKAAELPVTREAPREAPAVAPLDPQRPWTEDQWNLFLNNRTPRTAQWLRNHPEYASNVEARERIIGAHEYVTKLNRLKPDTDEYFDSLEKALNPQAKPVEKAADKPAPKAAPKPPAAAAPPSRTVPGADGPGSGRVTLSKQERETARILFPDMTPEKAELTYARNKLALQTEGRMGRA
jgi:hypothetical protein